MSLFYWWFYIYDYWSALATIPDSTSAGAWLMKPNYLLPQPNQQLKTTFVGVVSLLLSKITNTTTTSPCDYISRSSRKTSWVLVCSLILTPVDNIWKITSIIFENGRLPHFFLNGRLPKKNQDNTLSFYFEKKTTFKKDSTKNK